MKITGTKTDGGAIRGTIHVGHLSSSQFLPYEGEYEVEPLVSSQVLSTRDKIMTDDLTILSISYQDVSNAAGGRTVTIGSDF